MSEKCEIRMCGEGGSETMTCAGGQSSHIWGGSFGLASGLSIPTGLNSNSFLRKVIKFSVVEAQRHEITSK